MLEHRVVASGGLAELVPAWRELARRAAHSPFESPDWLVPWHRHYGAAWRSGVLTWWRDGDLVGVAPLAIRRRREHGVLFRELSFWGWTQTPLRGWVDLLVDPGVAESVVADFAAWLERGRPRWDVFQYVHLRTDSPLLTALAAPSRPWWHVDLSFALHSLEYVIALPSDGPDWAGPLGPKARHEIRREMRLYERRFGGQFGRIGEPPAAEEVVAALRALMREHWGDDEAYFERDPRFGSFLVDAVRQAFEAALGWAVVARDPDGIDACLLMLGLGPTAVATLLGVSPDPRYRSMSLGKCLFHRAIDEAAERGFATYSFLTENGYKQRYWHAEGRPTSSGFLGRGRVGRTIAGYTTVRRVVPYRLRERLAGRGRLDYRP